MLIVSIALIIIIPIVIDVLFSIYSRKKADKDKDKGSELEERSGIGSPPPGGNLGSQHPTTSNRMVRPRERPPPTMQINQAKGQKPGQGQVQSQRPGEYGPREFTSKEDLFRKIK